MQNHDPKKKQYNVKNLNADKAMNFIGSNDSGHAEIPDKSYLAVEKDKEQDAGKNNSDGMIMLDIFGALNYYTKKEYL